MDPPLNLWGNLLLSPVQMSNTLVCIIGAHLEKWTRYYSISSLLAFELIVLKEGRIQVEERLQVEIFWSVDIAGLKYFAFQLRFLKPRHSTFFRWNSMTLMVKLKDVNVPKGSLKFVFARLFPNQITTLLQWDSPNQRGEYSTPLIFIIRDYQIVSSHITL